MSFKSIFSSPVIAEVLALLYLNSESQYYQREIAIKTHNNLTQVQRALNKLYKAELITKSQQGRMIYYQANIHYPAFKELKGLLVKTVGYSEILSDALESLKDDIDFAFIYGSFASGTETAESDIDLFIITGLSLKTILSTIVPIRMGLGRELNISTYTKKEFFAKLTKDDHFIKNVTRSPKIWLIGNADDLEKISG